jgi:predicted transcriptional regulator
MPLPTLSEKGATLAVQRIRVRLHADEWARLQRLAGESGRTVNQIMRDALREHADKH